MSLWKKKKNATVVDLPKPEEKKEPTYEEIAKEYGPLIAQLGEKHYHISCLQEDVEMLTKRCRQLNQAAAIAKQREQEALKAAEAQKAAEESKGTPSNA